MMPKVRKLISATRQHLIREGHRRIRGYEEISGRIPQSLQVCLRDSCSECGKMPGSRQPFRIVYLLPSMTHAVGGVKISYQECEMIAQSGTPSFVFHPERPNFVTTWFDHEVPVLRSGHFDPRTDFLVFPDVWAAVAGEFCVPAGIRYAIFVQNGYLADFKAAFPLERLRDAYRHASLVMTISDDTTEMVKLVHPYVRAERLMRVVYSVPRVFSPARKDKIITYMPRKLRQHSEKMSVYLDGKLPAGWQLVPIDNLGEAGVVELLGRSAVFLSFSVQEGCPLPPVEAALAGNLVVGYTGEGAKEYFNAPVFREVYHGDFRTFVDRVLEGIREVEAGILESPAVEQQRQWLVSRYSRETEAECLRQFVASVTTAMSPG